MKSIKYLDSSRIHHSDFFGSNQVLRLNNGFSFGDLKDFQDTSILNLTNSMMRLKQIKIRSDSSHIHQIQFVLTDGKQILELSRHGGQGGVQHEYNVQDGHRVTKIEIWSKEAVDALRFTTDKGDVSKIFGNTFSLPKFFLRKTPITIKVVLAPLDGYLIGLKGKNSSIINMISFIWFIPER